MIDEAAQSAFRSAVEHAIRCGELLIEAKAALAHGSWGAWIAGNFPASDRTARGYMRLARHAADVNQAPEGEETARLRARAHCVLADLAGVEAT